MVTLRRYKKFEYTVNPEEYGVCKYSDGGSYDPGDRWTPPYSEDPCCNNGFTCPFDTECYHQCMLYHLQERNNLDFEEIFCFDSELRKDGEIYCRITGEKCNKTGEIGSKVRNSNGERDNQYIEDCPIQVHDCYDNLREGKEEYE